MTSPISFQPHEAEPRPCISVSVSAKHTRRFSKRKMRRSLWREKETTSLITAEVVIEAWSLLGGDVETHLISTPRRQTRSLR